MPKRDSSHIGCASVSVHRLDITDSTIHYGYESHRRFIHRSKHSSLVHAVLQGSAPAMSAAATVLEPSAPSPPQKRRKTTVQHTHTQTLPIDVWRGKYIQLTEAQEDKSVYKLQNVEESIDSYGLMKFVMESLGYVGRELDRSDQASTFQQPENTTVLQQPGAPDCVLERGESLLEVFRKLHPFLLQNPAVRKGVPTAYCACYFAKAYGPHTASSEFLLWFRFGV